MSLTTDYPDNLQPLCQRLNLNEGINHTHQWSAAADFLTLMVDFALADKPLNLVECSSGLTTLMLARCCQLSGQGHITSLENGADYAQATIEALKLYNLTEYATVTHAPLINHPLQQQTYQWYEINQLSDNIDFLVIDGPPGFIQSWSRFPALPLLEKYMSKQYRILLDDAGREDEIALVAEWCRCYPQLSHQFIETERGCSILQMP